MIQPVFRPPRHPAGFTLVEAVVAILLLGILGSVAVAFIVRPVEGYRDLARRAELVDAAESALRRMQRDLRTALPNSVRRTNTASGFALEIIPVLEGGRYSITGTANEKLTFNSDDQFDIQHCLRNDTIATSGLRLVVNNLGATGDNVYDDANLGIGVESVITPTALTISITSATCPTSGFHHVTFGANHDFKGESPNQRVYAVTTPVSYLCDTTAGTLTRYYSYAINASQYTTAAAFTAANASSALVANRVAGCSVTTATAEMLDRALATLTLSVAEESEQISLVIQTMMDNSR